MFNLNIFPAKPQVCAMCVTDKKFMPPAGRNAEYLWDQGLQVLQVGLCTLVVHEHLDGQ